MYTASHSFPARKAFKVILTFALCITAVLCCLTSCEFRSLVPAEAMMRGNGGSGTDAVSGTPTTTTPAEPEPILYTDPLTGDKTFDDRTAVRPFAVCFSQSRNALYGQASVIIEAPYLKNGQKSIALLNTPNDSSPIRNVDSAADYLCVFSQYFDALLVASQTVPAPYECLTYISDEATPVFSATSDGSISTSQDKLSIAAGWQNKRLTLNGTIPLSFSETASALSNIPAYHVSFPLNDDILISYAYDPSTHTYLRYLNEQPVILENATEQISFVNLLILLCDSTTTETEEHYSVSLDVSQGSGYAVSESTEIPITWKADKTGALTFTTADGKPLSLNTGNTCISLIKASNKNLVKITK